MTSDAGGNLATSTLAGLGLASSADISAINAQLAGINNRLDDLTNRSNRAYSGVAMALAMTGGYLPESKNFAVAVNYGTFERQNAAALSTYFRLSDHVVLSGGVSYGVEQRQFGGRAGMLFAWYAGLGQSLGLVKNATNLRVAFARDSLPDRSRKQARARPAAHCLVVNITHYVFVKP